MQSEEQGPEFSDALAIFHRVLVPVDFSMLSQRAVHVALELHRRFESRVCLLNLTSEDANDRFLARLGNPTSSGRLVDDGLGALRRFVENVAPGHADAVEYDVQITRDEIGRIRLKAREWCATLLVLSRGTHRALLRTPSERITNALGVPVLLLQGAPDAKPNNRARKGHMLRCSKGSGSN